MLGGVPLSGGLAEIPDELAHVDAALPEVVPGRDRGAGGAADGDAVAVALALGMLVKAARGELRKERRLRLVDTCLGLLGQRVGVLDVGVAGARRLHRLVEGQE